MKKKILLTGATGFIGFNLLRDLINKYFVIIILRKKNYKIELLKKNNNLKIIYYKKLNHLNNSLKKIKVDTVIHCATYYSKKHNYDDIFKMNYSNILFGNVILENIKKIKFRKFINLTTVWENYNAVKDRPKNLYSAYKQSFSKILKFYQIEFPKIKFYNIFLSETFGDNDTREKLISVMKKKFKRKKILKIVSRNLFINILNIKDLINGINIILEKNIKKGEYVIKNSLNLKIIKIINYVNKSTKNKLKVNFLSNILIKEKIYKYKSLPIFKPKCSKLIDVVKFITD